MNNLTFEEKYILLGVLEKTHKELDMAEGMEFGEVITRLIEKVKVIPEVEE